MRKIVIVCGRTRGFLRHEMPMSFLLNIQQALMLLKAGRCISVYVTLQLVPWWMKHCAAKQVKILFSELENLPEGMIVDEGRKKGLAFVEYAAQLPDEEVCINVLGSSREVREIEKSIIEVDLKRVTHHPRLFFVSPDQE